MASPRSNRSYPVRVLLALWSVIDISRRLVLNLLFLLILGVVAVAVLSSGPKPLQEKTALVLNLRGALVEQHSASLRGSALSQLGGSSPQGVQLRDLVTVIDNATTDTNISRIVLVLDDFRGAGLPSLREVSAALSRFKAAGKPITAWGSDFDQRQYLLAAQANEVWLHPMGHVMLQGIGTYQNYYRDALDKAGVSVSVLRAGTFKNFGEPWVANGPSPESTEATAFVFNGLWSTYTSMVEKSRALPTGSVQALIDEAPQRLAAVNGDAAQLALSAKLVDALKTRDELRQLLIERGAADNDKKSFRQVGFEEYLAHARPRSTGDAVGVIVAQGEISDGVAPAGSIGGLSTAELVRQARNDETIKAVVLRVNSPGGSAFGSELVRRELELTRAAGKPVVVSMGDVAASGGYWISLAADEVLADEATVTGSIGALMVIPNASQALDKLGVHTAGTSTGWLVGTGDVRRPTDPRFLALLQTNLDHLYKDFVAKVAAGRKSTPDKIDPVAQGRIWTGAQARERGLVDRLGGLREAVASAAALAKLGDEPRTVYIEQDPGRTARLLNLLGEPLAVGWIKDKLLPDFNLAPQVIQDAQRELSWLADLTERRKPFSAFTHCLCGDY